MTIMERPAAAERMRALEAKLQTRTNALAEELLKPASRRDADLLLRLWDGIEAHRSEYTKLTKSLEIGGRPDKRRLRKEAYDEEKLAYALGKVTRSRLREWGRLKNLVELHADAPTSPLIDWQAWTPRNDLLYELDRGLHRLANSGAQDPDSLDRDFFPDIAMPAPQFDQLVSAAFRLLLPQGRARQARFLDVGCGGGTRVYLARRYFQRCDGLEYDKGYVDAAERFIQAIGSHGSRVIHADGITYDGYGEYDAIYFYRPIKNDVLLTALEQQIVNTARPGTIILAPYNTDLHFRKEIECARVDGPVFVAGMSQEEADALHRDALATGKSPIAASHEWLYDLGFWRVVVDAVSYDISSV